MSTIIPQWRKNLRSISSIEDNVMIIVDDATCEHNGKQITIHAENVKKGLHTANAWENSQQNPPEDLCQLMHLHEPAVVCCLKKQYSLDRIYTAMGPILLALNPFKRCWDLYSEAAVRRYHEAGGEGGEVLPPHVFAMADHAYHSMIRVIEGGDEGEKASQSILVSGESGAGKTMTTKFIMQYLASLSQQNSPIQTTKKSPNKSFSPKKQQQGIEQQVLQSNPILESFGNARTIRNDNSSCFGKFIEIRFNPGRGTLIGPVFKPTYSRKYT